MVTARRAPRVHTCHALLQRLIEEEYPQRVTVGVQGARAVLLHRHQQPLEEYVVRGV
jgi:hypothetical protein